MRQSFVSWEITAAWMILLYTSYHVVTVVTTTSRWMTTSNYYFYCCTIGGGGVLGQSLSHNDQNNNQNNQIDDEDEPPWNEPTQRPRSIQVLSDIQVRVEDGKDNEDDEEIIHLDHYDTSPNLQQEKDIVPIESNLQPPNTTAATTTTTGTNSTTTTTTTNNNNHNHHNDTEVDVTEVIVIALVDGTLVGLSRSTGNTLWKHPPPTLTPYPQQQQQQQQHPLVKPLVSTTTTIGGRSGSHNHQNQRFRNTMAVPSILDGKVYLTSTSEDCSLVAQQQSHFDIENNDDDHFHDDPTYDPSQNTGQCDLVEDTVTTTIQNLMLRTPFVDMKNHGRIYTSQRHSVAVAIHATTGQPIRTITTTTTSASTSSSSTTSEPPTMDPMMAIRESDETTKTTNDENETNEDDDILWLGRTDYTISVHEPITGDLDVQFTMAEMMSIQDMLLMENHSPENHPDQQQILQQYLLPHRSDRKTNRNNNNHNHPTGDDGSTHRAVSSSTRTESTLYGMIATPNGHVAYRNLYTGQIVWVAAEAFLHTPAVYAFDATSGRSLRVDIVPDVISPHGTMEYVSNELQKQLYEHHLDIGRLDRPYDTVMNEPVFGALPGTGQIYAIPLLQKVITTTTSSTTNNVGMDGFVAKHPPLSDVTSMTSTIPDAARAYVSGTLGYHNINNNNNNNQYYQEEHPLQQHHHSPYCHPSSPHYPRCLNSGNNIHGGSSVGPDRYNPYGYNNNINNHHHHHHRQFRNNKFPNTLSDVSSHQYPNHRHGNDDTGNEDGVVGNGAIVPFYHPDYGYQYIPPNHFYTINTEWNEQYRRRKRYKKFMRIVTSWIVPTVVAALFVTSFELGRRKKFKKEAASVSNIVATEGHPTESSNDVGIIQVNENIILGHGGHGTVVYKGMLEGRQVAVKRLLKTYNASADREISLLIESDGHPNVVRYHIKETRGDFVYLALELCDLSLHDLIGHIRNKLDRLGSQEIDEREKIFNATKSILQQITKGAEHLHRLRIVHRDLKPANILLASKKSQKYNTTDSTNITVYETFARGEYVAKISDMGLGKQLAGQSSYGGSMLNESSLRGESNGVQSSIIGIGPGSVGWQAPEVMRLRMPSDMSVKSDDALSVNPNDTGSDFSPMDVVSTNRTSRSVDIFSLGCIFYSTLIPGSHPFGEWYEREGNIMHDKPNLKAIESLSLEAHDLIRLMLCRDPLGRPTAKQIGEHPFFWESDRRLCLLCDLSDRLEQDAVTASGSDDTSFQSMLLAVEKNALKVVGTSWDRLLDKELINNVQRFRSYDPSSIRDLLRLIRNKYHHFDELPEIFKESIGSKPEGLSQYFAAKFPRLLLHVFHFCQSTYPCDDILSLKYAIPALRISTKTRSGAKTTTPNRMTNATSTICEETDSMLAEHVSNGIILSRFKEPSLVNEQCTKPVSRSVVSQDCLSDDGASDFIVSNLEELTGPTDEEDIIIWAGSTAAKTFQCRGWNRSDDEWQHQSDLISRRRDVNLVRCIEDPKFRTRLCNHWDESLGTFCPMRKKNKCIFAHGPVELRVKEMKRNRWGKLVDENGDCNNQRHSGGEDTYGAARSIENERKQEGKWNAKAVNGIKGKGVVSTKKKAPKVVVD